MFSSLEYGNFDAIFVFISNTKKFSCFESCGCGKETTIKNYQDLLKT